MSAYLVARLRAHSRVQIRAHTEVTALSGGSTLQRITLTDNTTGQVSEHPCRGLFCFIGARPATQWLSGLALDSAGFIRTDAQLDPEDLGATWTALGRAPLPFETSVPTVFAAGDVRLTSVKRVASAVGEGANAVRSIHTALGPHT
jgi:thioredoxin reductase (NADPH)